MDYNAIFSQCVVSTTQVEAIDPPWLFHSPRPPLQETMAIVTLLRC